MIQEAPTAAALMTREVPTAVLPIWATTNIKLKQILRKGIAESNPL